MNIIHVESRLRFSFEFLVQVSIGSYSISCAYSRRVSIEVFNSIESSSQRKASSEKTGEVMKKSISKVIKIREFSISAPSHFALESLRSEEKLIKPAKSFDEILRKLFQRETIFQRNYFNETISSKLSLRETISSKLFHQDYFVETISHHKNAFATFHCPIGRSPAFEAL